MSDAEDIQNMKIPEWAKGVIIIVMTIGSVVGSFQVLMPDYTDQLNDIKTQIQQIKSQGSEDHDLNIVQKEQIKRLQDRVSELEEHHE